MTITKAMLLAAGLGTRLRPLTDAMPKPMLPVRGRPLIDFALETLARGGVREVMINLHHLPEQIRSYVGDGAQFHLRAHYSFEPTILGTGGGLKRREHFFGREPFLLMNADTLIDLDLSTVIEHHCARASSGTLVIRRLQARETYTPVEVAADGRLLGFGRGRHCYAGVQIGTAELLDRLPAGKPACVIADGIKPLLAAGAQFTTFLHEGLWNDVGTPERYALAQQQ